MFKSNSRFSSLIDENDNHNKISDKKNNKQKNNLSSDKNNKLCNTLKSDKLNDDRKNNRFKLRDDIYNEYYIKEKEAKEKEAKEKERKQLEFSDINNFPDLLGNVKIAEIKKPQLNYAKKLKHINETEIIDKNKEENLVDLQPGWILLKKEKKLYKAENKNIENMSEKEINEEIINSIIKSYEKRTAEFIDLNGYETWEKMFKFPNWQDENNYSDEETDEETDEDSESDSELSTDSE